MWIMTILAILLVSGTEPAPVPDLETLQRGIDGAWKADIEGWAEYGFRRRVTRKSFNADGEETFRQDMEFLVLPGKEGFDELLVKMDGREPTAAEIKNHRNKATFTKHYRQAAELNIVNPIGEDIALLPVIRAQDHRFVGEEEVDGVPCYRMEFDARPESSGGSAKEKLNNALKGSGCFSKEGYHLVVFEMQTVRQIKQSLSKLNSMKLTIEGQAVGDAWVPKRVQLRSDGVAVGKAIRKQNDWRYDEFRHEPPR